MHYKLPILAWLVFFVSVLNAQTPEFTKQVTRDFRAGSAMSVDINNKYGKVQVITWNVDSVRITINLRIKAKDKSKLQKLQQSIDFDFVNGPNYVVVKTKLPESGSDVFKDIVDIAGSYFSPSNSVTIDYTVMVPASTNLKIENKFGNVYVDDLSGNLNATLSYGDFNGNKLGGTTEVRISAGDADITFVKDGLIAVSYGNLHIREASKMIAETRSSNVTIEKVSILTLNSRRDKVYLNETGTLTGSSYFSAINASTLFNDMSFSCRYGSFSMNHIKKTISSIGLSSEYTDVSLAFEKFISFGIDLTHHQDVEFIYPKSLAELKTRVLDVQDKMLITTGRFGQSVSDSKVVIKALRKCNVSLSFL